MLNTNEKKHLIDFLEDLVSKYSTAGCNDLYLDATDENIIMCEKVMGSILAEENWDRSEITIKNNKFTAPFPDWMLVQFLAEKMEETQPSKEEEASLTPTQRARALCAAGIIKETEIENVSIKLSNKNK